ncbi:unnamed protein product [Enterobius vermicularis]|uniref:Transmembrane protein 216 n=1 Tax=Enterobius vermicularis TaxID=51028 RepID=A0A0N4VIF0_ENTVE|nr:unnamed protein product [Enterobius vermicularis]
MLFESLNCCSIFFQLFFFSINVFTLLPYAPYVIVCELLLIMLFAPIEAVRLFWGRKGNLTETPAYISFSMLISIPIIAMCVYWGFFQSYVLLVEFVFVVIEGVLVIVELLLGIIAAVSMSRYSL